MFNSSRQSQPDLLASLKIAAPCNVSWDSMEGDERVRHCGQCSKNVYNISTMTRDEANRFLQATDFRACVNFYRRQDGTILVDNCPVGLRRLRNQYKKIAAGIATVISFAQSVVLGVSAGEQVNNKPDDSNSTSVLGGKPSIEQGYIRGKLLPNRTVRGEAVFIPSSAAGSPVQGPVHESTAIKNYRQEIKLLIAKALPKGKLGHAAFSFTVSNNGNIENVLLLNKSPNENTDKQIVKNLRNLKLPCLPDAHTQILSVYYECSSAK